MNKIKITKYTNEETEKLEELSKYCLNAIRIISDRRILTTVKVDFIEMRIKQFRINVKKLKIGKTL